MKILFVRHAETDWNKANRFQGIIDIDINEHGKYQAKLLSEYLYKQVPDINKIYTSPLKRTKHTAMFVAKKFDFNITKDINIMGIKGLSKILKGKEVTWKNLDIKIISNA